MLFCNYLKNFLFMIHFNEIESIYYVEVLVMNFMKAVQNYFLSPWGRLFYSCEYEFCFGWKTTVASLENESGKCMFNDHCLVIQCLQLSS